MAQVSGPPDRRVPLEASRSRIPDGLKRCPDPDPEADIDATILLQRRSDAPTAQLEAILRGQAPALSREQAAASLGADPGEIQLVREFAESHGLTMLEESAARRSVRVGGTVARMEEAFGTKLHSCETAGRTYTFYDGVLSIPAALDGVIVGVLGLDRRPIARR